jgi:E3 ubiquitin-protein ligase BRE1
MSSPDNKASNLPQAITIDALVYQNKQLRRLVQDLRRVRNSKAVSGDSNVADMNLKEVVEDLESERNKLYSRLYRLESHISMQQSKYKSETGVSIPQSAEYMDSSDLARQESPQGDVKGLIDSLQKELSRIVTALGVAGAVSTQGDRLMTSEIELFNLNSDRNLWLQKATTADKQLTDITTRVIDHVDKLESSMAITEKTFLTEIGRLADELAQRHHELRRYQSQISELEQKMKESNPQSLGAARQASSSNAEAESPQRLAEMLRFKEEQCTRLLTQLVQFQQKITSLEQEIVMLQSRDRMANELMNRTESELARMNATHLAQLEVVRALQDEYSKEQQLRAAIEKESSEYRSKYVQNEETNKSLQRAIKSMQDEFEAATKNLKEAKQSNLASTPVPIPANSSLLQMEVEELRERVKCPLCQARFRSVTLITCMHCFCRECVDEKMLNARNRKCPLCMQRFADADVRRLM